MPSAEGVSLQIIAQDNATSVLEGILMIEYDVLCAEQAARAMAESFVKVTFKRQLVNWDRVNILISLDHLEKNQTNIYRQQYVRQVFRDRVRELIHGTELQEPAV
jgi:hypothetical protein